MKRPRSLKEQRANLSMSAFISLIRELTPPTERNGQQVGKELEVLF